MTIPAINLNDYLKDLEYLVNIDSGSADIDGVKKLMTFLSKNLVH